MIIGITINNILRNHIEKLSEAYEAVTLKKPIEPINPFELYDSFPKEEDDDLEFSEFDENNQSDGETSDTDLGMAGNDVSFDVYEFMYMDAAFEVFGRCEQSEDNIISKLATLKNSEVELILLNKESPRSKCATLFFLSKTNFDLNRIAFPDQFKDFGNYCDVIVTDNPRILESIPAGKIIIKVQNQFNVDYKADFTILKTSELFDIIEDVKAKYNQI
jgi:hypothetical protein